MGAHLIEEGDVATERTWVSSYSPAGFLVHLEDDPIGPPLDAPANGGPVTRGAISAEPESRPVGFYPSTEDLRTPTSPLLGPVFARLRLPDCPIRVQLRRAPLTALVGFGFAWLLVNTRRATSETGRLYLSDGGYGSGYGS